jgi:hypothetical protein
MGQPKGKSGNPAGKPKGTTNHISRLAKENIEDVFGMVGGLQGMADWAKENRTAFYGIYAKLLPLQLTGAGGGSIKTELTVLINGIASDHVKD